jgi:hypothetical protein
MHGEGRTRGGRGPLAFLAFAVRHAGGSLLNTRFTRCTVPHRVRTVARTVCRPHRAGPQMSVRHSSRAALNGRDRSVSAQRWSTWNRTHRMCGPRTVNVTKP